MGVLKTFQFLEITLVMDLERLSGDLLMVIGTSNHLDLQETGLLMMELSCFNSVQDMIYQFQEIIMAKVHLHLESLEVANGTSEDLDTLQAGQTEEQIKLLIGDR